MVETQAKEELTTVLVSRWEQSCRKVVELAEALPSDKLDWRPAPGIRTPAEVLRHVAFWNRYVADSLAGGGADDSGNELPAAEYSEKEGIIDALRGASTDAAQAISRCDSERDPKTSGLVITFIEHTMEHYGQLVVYARLLSIVPPASRS